MSNSITNTVRRGWILSTVTNFVVFNINKVNLKQDIFSNAQQQQQKQHPLKVGPEPSTFWTQHVGFRCKNHTHCSSDIHTVISLSPQPSVRCLGLRQGLGKQSSLFLFKRAVIREAWLASEGEKRAERTQPGD